MNKKFYFQSNGIEIYNDDFLTTNCILGHNKKENKRSKK